MSKEILKELNVEKLNICEPDGTVKLALFNSKNVPGMFMEGEDILPGHRAGDGISGLMFYNNHGDECGGLIYGSNVDENGKVQMGMSLTLDKWKQDQLVQLHLDKDGDAEKYGLSIYDRPNMHIRDSVKFMNEFHKTDDIERKRELVKILNKDNQRRLFVGHDIDGETKVSLYSKDGSEQLRISIDDTDKPKLILMGKEISLEELLSNK